MSIELFSNMTYLFLILYFNSFRRFELPIIHLYTGHQCSCGQRFHVENDYKSHLNWHLQQTTNTTGQTRNWFNAQSVSSILFILNSG